MTKGKTFVEGGAQRIDDNVPMNVKIIGNFLRTTTRPSFTDSTTSLIDFFQRPEPAERLVYVPFRRFPLFHFGFSAINQPSKQLKRPAESEVRT
jgi:hypothetical protein